MNFYRVAHWKPEEDDDDEPRVAAVVAENASKPARFANTPMLTKAMSGSRCGVRSGPRVSWTRADNWA
jgi:hypothetical protein